MFVNTRPTIVSFALKTLTSAVACAVLLSASAQAAGLGKLTVLSSLGQPLRAEIELTSVASDESGALVAKLAPGEAFRLANIEFNPTLLSLRFTVEQRNGRQYIKITSTQPVNEPFVDMLLELSWSNGRLVREYTFLLDPVELRQTQPAQVAVPNDVAGVNAPAAAPRSARTPAPAVAAPSAPKREKAEKAEKLEKADKPEKAEKAEKPVKLAKEPAAAQPAGATSGDYKVKAGDSLGRIASQLKPSDVSLDMMLVALYRANPDAFVGNNMNRLRSGQILALPTNEAIHATADADARGVVVAHTADFNAYRNKLANQVAQSTPTKAPEASQSATGKITAKVAERPTVANESKDQLKLSKAAPSASAVAKAGKGATGSAEDMIAKQQQLAEAAARVKELEKNAAELERLTALNAKLAADKKKAAAAVVAPVPVPVAAPVAAPTPAPVVAAVPPAPKPLVVKPKPAPKVVAPAEPGLLDLARENMTSLGAALAALLLGVGALAYTRRKKNASSPSETSLMGATSTQTPSLFAETGGQSVDTSNSVFNSSFAPSASQLDTNEVDPVAEADVYIAYGRDAQAEEILKEALRTHPERHPVRLKLLEIYATRKDPRAFETQASELYAMTKGQGDEWAQAAAMGLTIDPLNPLYAGAAAPATVAPHAAEAEQQALLSQQLDAAAQEAAPSSSLMNLDLDLSADATPTAVPHTPTAAAKADDFDSALDFDLGGLSFEPVAPGTPAAAPAAAAAEPVTIAAVATPAEENFDMSFDMGFDAPAAATVTPTPAPVAAEDDFGLGDFDLAAIPTTPAPAPTPADDLHSMDFHLPEAAPAAATEPTASDMSVDDFFAIPEPVSPATVAAAPEAHEFDLSGINLDLPQAATESVHEQVHQEAPAEVAGEMSAVHMEMETKLDLAVAYQEIGDKEGARELIDEVLKDGNAEQIAKANTMRALLA